MAECIEREALLHDIEQSVIYTARGKITSAEMRGAHKIIERIKCAPAVDVAPVAHSYWESYDCSQYMGTDEYGEPKWRDGKFYVCHNHRCRRKTVVKSHYCPNCGAKMDGAE